MAIAETTILPTSARSARTVTRSRMPQARLRLRRSSKRFWRELRELGSRWRRVEAAHRKRLGELRADLDAVTERGAAHGLTAARMARASRLTSSFRPPARDRMQAVSVRRPRDNSPVKAPDRMRAVASPARRMILSIARASKDGVPVGMFVERLTLSQPTVSHHLRVLREAGLVEGERRGIYVYYRVVPEAVDALSRALAA